MKLSNWQPHDIASMSVWEGALPLWQRVPKRDEVGRLLTDFMMLAPGLNRRRPAEIEALMQLVRGVLERFPADVVFADFNLRLNLLWVSLRQRPGAMTEIVFALRRQAPIFRLVGHHVPAH